MKSGPSNKRRILLIGTRRGAWNNVVMALIAGALDAMGQKSCKGRRAIDKNSPNVRVCEPLSRGGFAWWPSSASGGVKG